MAARPTEEALRAYLAAGEIVKAVKRDIPTRARAGTLLLELAQYAESEIARLGGRPAFPCNISINEVASHSTPQAGDQRVLRRGDIVKVDIGAMVDGYIADSAITVEVETGACEPLIRAAELALADALAVVRPGARAGEIGGAIEASARDRGFRVLKGLYGHSLERNCLHGGLTIPNYDDGSRRKVHDGDVIAIEPFLTAGSGEILRMSGGGILQLVRRSAGLFADEGQKKLLRQIERNYDGFPFARRWLAMQGPIDRLIGASVVMEYPVLVEKDGMPVAQAEHTVVVGREGGRIIT